MLYSVKEDRGRGSLFLMRQAHSSSQQIDRAVACLSRGGVVAFPTDTLFALGADAFSAEAIQAVFRIKQRLPDMGCPLLLSDIDQLATVAIEIPSIAWELAQRFWPGALTLVLPKSPSVPEIATGGKDTVAVRMPDHPLALNLIRALGRPLTGTSANVSGAPDPLSAQQVRDSLVEACPMLVDGPPAPRGVASTILDVTDGNAKLFREGAISWQDVASALGPARSR